MRQQSSTETRDNWGDTLRRVLRGGVIEITQRGEPIAVLLPKDESVDVWRFGEREAVIAILRELCDEFGDNDWPDDLHLADVIEKHLAKYLWKEAENGDD